MTFISNEIILNWWEYYLSLIGITIGNPNIIKHVFCNTYNVIFNYKKYGERGM